MTTVATWVFFACYGQWCVAPETRIVPGLTEAQCRYLESVYSAVPVGVWDRTKDYRYAECIEPNTKPIPRKAQ